MLEFSHHLTVRIMCCGNVALLCLVRLPRACFLNKLASLYESSLKEHGWRLKDGREHIDLRGEVIIGTVQKYRQDSARLCLLKSVLFLLCVDIKSFMVNCLEKPNIFNFFLHFSISHHLTCG